jgi:hypothetical protein
MINRVHGLNGCLHENFPTRLVGVDPVVEASHTGSDNRHTSRKPHPDTSIQLERIEIKACDVYFVDKRRMKKAFFKRINSGKCKKSADMKIDWEESSIGRHKPLLHRQP